MHRKLLVVAAFLVVPASASAQRVICDPRQSALCAGVSSVYQLEEDSDSRRLDAYGYADIREADGVNVGRATGKIGSYAASFAGTDGAYLFLPYDGALGGGTWTVAMWVYPTSAAATQIVLSKDEATIHGSYLALVPNGGQLQVKGVGYYHDTGAEVSVTSSSSMSLSAWHLVVWGVTPYLFGKQEMFLQLDNGVRNTISLDYWLKGNANDLIIGQRKGASAGSGYTLPYSGRIDQLTFSGRHWEADSSTLFYNAGSGAAFPFTASATAGLNSGLLAYWKLDETSGNRVDSVNGNDFTDPTSSVTSGAGKLVTAAYRDTNGERLSVASNSMIEYSGDFTVGGWVKLSGHVSAGIIASKLNTTTYYGEWYLQHTGSGGTDKLEFWAADSSGSLSGPPAGSCTAQTGAAPMLDNTWYFVLAEYVAATKTCKVTINNGTTYTGTGTTAPSVQTSIPLALGGEANGASGMVGYLDGWFFYKRILDATNKSDLYNGGTGRDYPF